MNQDLCKNCAHPLSGPYCHQCGQSIRGSDRFIFTLVNEAFEDIFSLNSRAWKTISSLLFRPGFLSKEYFSGRRVRYIPPVRLYFTTSILFFLVASLVTFFSSEESEIHFNDDRTQETVAVTEPATPDEEAQDSTNQVAVGETDAEQKDGLNITITDGELDVPWLSEEKRKKLETRLQSQVEKAKQIYAVNPNFVEDYVREVAPPIIFCLLPLFALLLKIVYVFKGMYYTQHLVLAVHNHCFVFFWLTIQSLISVATAGWGWLHGVSELVLFAWVPIYLWRSLRVVYEQGIFLTSIKFLVLVTAYSILIGVAAFGAMLFGVLTL